MAKNPPANAGDTGLIPGSGRSRGGGNGNPLQYSCLENSMDRGACRGYSPWGDKELDTNERLSRSQCQGMHMHAKHPRKAEVSLAVDQADFLDVWGHYEIISTDYKSLKSHTSKSIFFTEV